MGATLPLLPSFNELSRALQNRSFAQCLRYQLVEILEYEDMLWFQPSSGLDVEQNP
jgi:hypothetical protein